MKPISFNDGWYVCHLEDSGLGTPVAVPHDAMLAEPRSGLAPSGINAGWFEGADYRYTKKFHLHPQWRGKHLILEFEGVYRNAEVWINGQKAAYRPYGYTNFYVSLDPFLRDGENTLEVIARNADQPNSRWYSGAGIYRPVTLWAAPEEHILLNGVKIRTLSINPAVVQVSVKTSAPGPVCVEVLSGESVVAAASGEGIINLEIPNARLWDPENPNLYLCRVKFGEDEVMESFGIRSLTWGKEGLQINGKRVILRGACIHHDNGILGACCYPDAEERRIRLLKQNGYNAVRSAHNPCSKSLLCACDKLGVLMMDEYIDHWYIHKTEYDYVEHFDRWWRQDLSDMVDKDYNHPCVILYSTGNEVSETAQPRGIALTGQLTEYLHSLDNSRPVTCGVNIFFNFLSSIGFGVYSDKKAKKEVQKAEKNRASPARKKKAVGSQFFNDLAGLLGADFMKLGATLHGCDVKTRDAFANMDIAGYNYGILRYQHDLKKYPHRLILGSETFCSDAYRFWELAKTEKRIIGDFVWAGMDYLGEVGVGSWEYREYAPEFQHGPGWITAGSGRIDLTGKPLGEAAYTRVALEQETGPVIAVRPVCFAGQPHSPSAWKMTNAMESWSWHGCQGKKAHVEVYARAAHVELLLNGKSVGRKAANGDCLFTFSVPYADGKLEAISYDEAGKKIGQTSLTTAGEATVLAATAEEKTVRPGHLCFIRLQYTDEAGILKPMERGIIQVQVEGGRLLGIGSACPFYPYSYLDTKTDTYYGEAMAVVQAGDSGQVTVSAWDGKYRANTTVPILP